MWAAAAEAYATALYDAFREGITDAMPFYAPGTHVDKRFVDYEGIGRPGFAQTLRDNSQFPPVWLGGHDTSDSIDLVPTEPLYLSRDGFLDPLRLLSLAIDPSIDVAILDTVGAAGITDEMIPTSAESGQWTSRGPTSGAVLALASDYLEGWASADRSKLLDHYAADATLTDSLLGLELSGATAIATAGVGSSPVSLRGATLHEIPDGAGPAAYTSGAYGMGISGVDRLVLLMDVTVSGDCPGDVATVLWLDAATRITREERLHRIDSVRRCTPADQFPGGWWDTVAQPTTPPVTRTGTLNLGGHDIAVWNGDPRIDPILDWAQERFAQVGLPPPGPTSVTFLPRVDGDRWDAFGFMTGSDAPDLGLPFTADEACPHGPCRWPTAVRAATLHELAHLWLAPLVYRGRPVYRATGRRVQEFLAVHELAWHDADLPWAQQGAERAAETVAWGLMDQPYSVDPRLGPLTCAELTTDFQTLTNTIPNPRACAEP